MIFSWKKSGLTKSPRKEPKPLPPKPVQADGVGRIRFENVTLPPAISNLTLEIPLGSWVILSGEDDFAKALFCDLCFSYILPETGIVHPVLKGSDVSFLGRSNTTYGQSLVDHLSCGVRDHSKERLEYVARNILSDRFQRHVNAFNPLEFAEGKRSRQLDLDERDFLEISEANVLLQMRRAAVIDTTSDFYHIALEQGFRHSQELLNSGKTLIWIVDNANPIPAPSRYWQRGNAGKIELTFPLDARAGFIN
jgi:hypothetical protein